MEKFTRSDITAAAKILKEGGILAFPTETVYGLGVIFDNKKSFDKLVEVKQRPPEKPFTLMCSSVEELYKYATPNREAKKIIETFLPGPLTIILDVKKDVPAWVSLGTGHVGIRVPKDQFVCNLIKEVGKPLLVPSANKAGQPPLLDGNEIDKVFHGEIDGIVYGTCMCKIPSTVVDATSKVKLVREGSIPFSEILDI